MALKILHTSDVHIGMKFNGYPEFIRGELVEARFKALANLIQTANEKECRLFVIAGDLFDKTTIAKKDAERVINILEDFAGDCVLVMPGNHDYDNGMIELWDLFTRKLSDKIVVLNENKVYQLAQTHDLDVAIYPAPCNKKISKANNLGWINELHELPTAALHIGIAHGALEGLSPDLKQDYFYMQVSELEHIPVDLWLLGHTHVPYPDLELVKGHKIYNAGTPEPDGMDCSHVGHAWLIEIDEQKNVQAQRLATGYYRFIDTEEIITDWDSLDRLKQKYLNETATQTLLRLSIKGRVDRELFNQKQALYQELEQSLAYVLIDDSGLGLKITADVIDQEFTAGSLPHQLFMELIAQNDEEALQVAYELVREVKAG
ncbi:exonuclease subunit SbcD [Sporotomaculum syntrophicum]|uniref:Exonuclease subunit SbcD n=1 Tax=Sporotomaculum syntrophicum TaxID=182264 RepID=A0A9D3AXN4_9FIRM|nr:metallophosphoesterase [Sporotomaculum syntrophicum]KAF1085227.1 exonuclease subunit SbcD [Sporotomaculum syntrophicum]